LNRSQRGIRLLVVTPLFPPAIGGASEDFRILTREWQRMPGMERIFIVTERSPGTARRERHGRVTEVFRLLPARDTALKMNWLGRKLRSALTYALLPVLLAWKSRRQGFGPVLLHGRYAGRTLVALLNLFSISTVVFLSDLHTRPETLVGAAAVICNSEAVFARARDLLKPHCPVYLAPVAFDSSAATSANRAANFNYPYFLFAGEISAAKGVDVLLQAFSAFRVAHPACSLLLAGPERDGSLLRGQPDSVNFLGALPRPMLLSLMRGADAVLLPSRSESLPRVCLEAIAMGKRVLLPPGVPEFERSLAPWCLKEITASHLLARMETVSHLREPPPYDFSPHDPQRIARQILGICCRARPAP
jgi:glycosyltransferase involved in cell wall biosynthesis